MPQGRGPAWSNSLFEDNAEFGLGMRLAVDKQADYARELLRRLAPQIGENSGQRITAAPTNRRRRELPRSASGSRS